MDKSDYTERYELLNKVSKTQTMLLRRIVTSKLNQIQQLCSNSEGTSHIQNLSDSIMTIIGSLEPLMVDSNGLSEENGELEEALSSIMNPSTSPTFNQAMQEKDETIEDLKSGVNDLQVEINDLKSENGGLRDEIVLKQEEFDEAKKLQKEEMRSKYQLKIEKLKSDHILYCDEIKHNLHEKHVGELTKLKRI